MRTGVARFGLAAISVLLPRKATVWLSAGEPTAVAKNAPAPGVQQARKEDKSPAPEMRTAYSAPPPASNNGLLQGAQPVVPAGSFESRWTALR